MDVLMLTKWDWANTAYRFAKSLRLLGLEVGSYKGLPLGFFGYPEQDPIHPLLAKPHPRDKMHPIFVEAPGLKGFIESAKIVYFMHSTFVNTGADLKNKYVIVQHGGITYRVLPEKSNEVFNPIADTTIIQTLDLWNLGAVNECFVFPPVDTDLLQPIFERTSEGKVLIGHFPSNPDNKGTVDIVKAIKELENDPALKGKFEYVGLRDVDKFDRKGVPWLKQLDRVRKCDVIIETHKLELGGKPFGAWGNTAIEAASLGKVVITNSVNQDLYTKEYGSCALHIANDHETLKEKLINLITMSEKELLEEKHKSRDWVVEKHSLMATGRRLDQKIFSKVLQKRGKQQAFKSDLAAKKKHTIVKPKVLMLTSYDWANTGWRFFKCLEMIGCDVIFYKGHWHQFGYTVQGEILETLSHLKKQGPFLYVEAKGLEKEAKQADVVHFIASTYVGTGISLKNKNVVVQHGGTTYRQNPDEINRFFNVVADATVIQCPDLLGLGAKNEHLIYYPVDTDLLQPVYERQSDKLLIGHFPSTPATKGTNTILKVIEELSKNKAVSDRFEYVGVENDLLIRVPWERHLNRVRKCDIIIETCNSFQKEKVYGEWGNAALEAAALGKVVITNSLTQDIYAKEYGDSALHIANNSAKLYEELENVLNLSDKEIEQDRQKTRAWVEQKHSMEATGKRLWEKIYKEF